MSKNEEEKTIVIIGDWFIDENWLVAKHTTYSSSHTGDIHYLSKTAIDKRMISLCGASEIFEVLRSYFNNSNRYLFIGYGAWNVKDNDILQCTLCSKDFPNKHFTQYTIKSLPDIIEKKEGNESIPICPYNEESCDYNPHLINLAKKEGKISTNRIIRRYEGYGSGIPHLLDRTDWQLPISDSDLDYRVFNNLKDKNVAAVVIEDHGKGVINEESINSLIKVLGAKTKYINWYIRSKMDNPEWMKILYKNKIKIRLKVLDYKLAIYKKGQRRWQFGKESKELGHASLEILGELTGDSIYKHGDIERPEYENNTQRAAILFDENFAITKEEDKCFNLYKSPGPKQLINIGRTTTFFNALLAQDLMDNAENFGTQCYKALQCAFEWSKVASKAWSQENPYFYGDYSKALDSLNRAYRYEIPPYSYSDLWDKWNSSSKELGILKIKNEDIFQLWRGEGALEGYITVGSPKRDAINGLITKVYQFQAKKTPKYPFNSLLIASPGWGKSFLAKCLAKHFDMHYLEFSLSQMASSKDLVDCFDTICSAQNRIDKKVLVFMDEINCEIEGHSAMGLLLSPIWDGTFIRNGKTYQLLPAVWIFASTDPIDELVIPKKGSDFVSRLNGPVIELDSLATKGSQDLSVPLKELKKKLVSNPNFYPYQDRDYKLFDNLDGAFRTEQVYLGVSLVNNIWGPINKIQKDILKLFHKVLPIHGFRSLEFFVSKFHNIQRGIVICSNVPSVENFKELTRHIVLPEYWNKKIPHDNMEDLVKIETILQ